MSSIQKSLSNNNNNNKFMKRAGMGSVPGILNERKQTKLS